MKKNIDFSKGNIILQLIIFSVPIVLGELLQNLYNSTDSLIVGNFIGTTAQAAVSVCLSPSQLLVGFFNGMSVGASVVVARSFGGKSQQDLDRSIRISFTFSVLLGVLLSALGILCAPILLRITAADASIYAAALTYLRIYLAGLMFTVIYNVGAGILRAIGDARSPFLILSISCCLNILLDILFVTVFSMGIIGVGLATVISQFTSVVMVYHKLRTANSTCYLAFRELAQNRTLILSILRIGIPAGLQNSLISISNLFVWRYINRFTPNDIAGIGIAQRLDQFVSLPCKAFGLTITTMVSQNMGAGNYARTRNGIAKCMVLSLCTITALGAVTYVFADCCVALFNPDPEVVAVGIAMMHTIIPLYFTMAIREVFLGALRGYGNARTPMFISLFGMIAIRQIYLFIAMNYAYRIEFIYYCYPIAWGSTAFMLVIYYFLTRKQYAQLCTNKLVKQ